MTGIGVVASGGFTYIFTAIKLAIPMTLLSALFTSTMECKVCQGNDNNWMIMACVVLKIGIGVGNAGLKMADSLLNAIVPDYKGKVAVLGKGVVKVTNEAIDGVVDVSNQIGDGSKDAANKVGDAFKSVF